MLIATRFLLFCAAMLAPITTFADDPPLAPSELRVVIDSGGLRLLWKDNSQNESGFEISDGETNRITGAQTTFYRWGGMRARGEYKCFKVRAYSDAGESVWEPNVEPWYRCGTTEGSGPLRSGVIPTGNYAGYAASGDEFNRVSAVWWVPAVDCGIPNPVKTTRAAPWVGLAGKDIISTNKALRDHTWLIQVGTVSQCQFQFPPTKYEAAWQRLGMGGDPLPIHFENFEVRPNDLISAAVSYWAVKW